MPLVDISDQQLEEIRKHDKIDDPAAKTSPETDPSWMNFEPETSILTEKYMYFTIGRVLFQINRIDQSIKTSPLEFDKSYAYCLYAKPDSTLVLLACSGIFCYSRMLELYVYSPELEVLEKINYSGVAEDYKDWIIFLKYDGRKWITSGGYYLK